MVETVYRRLFERRRVTDCIATAAVVVAWLIPPAKADWFSRLDAEGRLQVTGIALDSDDTLTAAYLDCEATGLRLTFETRHTSAGADEITGPRISVTIRTANGNKTLTFTASPIATPSGILALTATAGKEEANELLDGLSRGRVDFRLTGRGLIHEGDSKRIYATGSIQAATALRARCWK